MKKPEDIKDRVIAATTELIIAGSGTVDEITTRAIAERAQVGVGLVNYHFQTKENLIELCVQRIISNVIAEFKPPEKENLSCIERLQAVAKAVADFLAENPSVSRISILGDYNRPQASDNTMRAAQGFMNSLQGTDLSESTQKILMFELVSILQAAFLRRDLSKELWGYDFNCKPERDRFIDLAVKRLMKGCVG